MAITGASGFLGRHLLPELSSRGIRIVEISRDDLAKTNLHLKLHGVDVIIHLAGRAHILRETTPDPGSEFWSVNVGLTQLLARAAELAGVRRFVFISSAGVLGAASPPGGFTDDSTPSPHDAYTRSKFAAEQWLSAELNPGIDLVILRAPLIYGAHAKGNLMRIFRSALAGVPLPIGGLRAQRSMIGVRNLADLIYVVATDRHVNRSTLLVSERETISITDLYKKIAKIAGHDPWLAPLPISLIRWCLNITGRRSDAVRLTAPFVLRPTRAQSAFGWTPPHSLDEELRHAVLCELNSFAREEV